MSTSFVGEIGLWLVVILSLLSAGHYFFSFWGRLGLGGDVAIERNRRSYKALPADRTAHHPAARGDAVALCPRPASGAPIRDPSGRRHLLRARRRRRLARHTGGRSGGRPDRPGAHGRSPSTWSAWWAPTSSAAAWSRRWTTWR